MGAEEGGEHRVPCQGLGLCASGSAVPLRGAAGAAVLVGPFPIPPQQHLGAGLWVWFLPTCCIRESRLFHPGLSTKVMLDVGCYRHGCPLSGWNGAARALGSPVIRDLTVGSSGPGSSYLNSRRVCLQLSTYASPVWMKTSGWCCTHSVLQH